jgi:hypothetical protein
MNLDTRPLEQRTGCVAPSRSWQAVVNAHRAQQLAQWHERLAEWNKRQQQQQQQKEQHAGAASKKQKH